MRFIHFTTTLSMALAMLSVNLPAFADTAADNPALSSQDHAFLDRALADDTTQIAMAKLALQKSSNPKVIALAHTIVQERGALDTRLTQVLAQNGGNAPSPAPVDNATLSGLQSLNGDAFDKSFAGLLVKDHYHVIAAYEAMKVTCTHAGLQGIAHDAIPQLQENLAVALDVLRTENWQPSTRQNALTAVDAHGSKVPVYWEPISIVAAPW